MIGISKFRLFSFSKQHLLRIKYFCAAKGGSYGCIFQKDSGCCRKFDGCLHLVRRGDMSENAEVLARF